MARRFAREQLRRSDADVDTVVLLVSEVVTNAVLHARSEVVVSVVDQGAVARIEVHDASPAGPRMHRFAVDSATGRGLRLIDQLAHRWGTAALPSGAGKVVWFEVGAADTTAWESFADSLLADGGIGDH